MSANDNIAPAVSLLSTGTDLTGGALPLFEVAWAALSYLLRRLDREAQLHSALFPCCFPCTPTIPTSR
jgi:hypothetical protein